MDRHELTLTEALERGPTANADDIRKRRTTLLVHPHGGTKGLDSLKERTLLRREYGSLASAETLEGKMRFLQRLPYSAVRRGGAASWVGPKVWEGAPVERRDQLSPRLPLVASG